MAPTAIKGTVDIVMMASKVPIACPPVPFWSAFFLPSLCYSLPGQTDASRTCQVYSCLRVFALEYSSFWIVLCPEILGFLQVFIHMWLSQCSLPWPLYWGRWCSYIVYLAVLFFYSMYSPIFWHTNIILLYCLCLPLLACKLHRGSDFCLFVADVYSKHLE